MSLISFNNVDRHFLVTYLDQKLSESPDTQFTVDFSTTTPAVLKGLLPEILKIIQKHNNVTKRDMIESCV